MTWRRLLIAVALTVAAWPAFWGFDWFLNAYRARLVPKNFAAVKPGVLYRSGQLRPEHLREVAVKHGIRTIFCLNPNEEPREKVIAGELGIAWIPYGMPGSGQGDAEQFGDFIAKMADPSFHPALVHCAAGAYRTGAASALFRMFHQGWTFDDAIAEMEYFGFAGQQDLIDHIRSVRASILVQSEIQQLPGSRARDHANAR